MIIAIDGPAGAGKSTVARLLAQELGFLYIDTGAMYRALTLKALDTNTPLDDPDALVRLARGTDVRLRALPDGSLQVFLDGSQVTAAIRQPRVTRFVSDVAKVGGVREVLVQLQRSLGRSTNAVLDGRDIGTVVFPDADIKFFIDADFKERVQRRYKELVQAGVSVSRADVSADLANRDTIDSSRACSPLRKASDAITIDTTSLSIPAVVEAMRRHLKLSAGKDAPGP